MRRGGDRTSSTLLRARGLHIRAAALPGLIEQKINALDQAAPLAGWRLPEEFATLRRLLEARIGKQGKREVVQGLRLVEGFRADGVASAVGDAIPRRAIGFAAAEHPVLCR